MFGAVKVSSRKVIKPVSKEHRKNSNVKLSRQLLDYLERKYQLLPHDMLNLREIHREGWVGKIPACFIEIYDQRKLTDGIRTFNDLDKYRDFIQYAGYILENGFIYITKYDAQVVNETP